VITGNNAKVDTEIAAVCDKYDSIDDLTTQIGATLRSENGELYLFIAELTQTESTMDEEMSGFSVTVVCHPDTTLIGQDIYGDMDDYGRAFIKEVVDELANLDPSTDSALIDEGVWNVYTFPKLNEARNRLESNTFTDPPKLSYFRISSEIGDKDRRFIAGSGIYLDVDNPNVDHPKNLNRLEDIRNRVRNAAALLVAEAEENEGLLGEMFFENDASDSDATDIFSQVINGTPVQEYVFVWENR